MIREWTIHILPLPFDSIWQKLANYHYDVVIWVTDHVRVGGSMPSPGSWQRRCADPILVAAAVSAFRPVAVSASKMYHFRS